MPEDKFFSIAILVIEKKIAQNLNLEKVIEQILRHLEDLSDLLIDY